MATKNKIKKTAKPKAPRVGILGYGEVGQAIASFYKKPKIKDLASGRNDFSPEGAPAQKMPGGAHEFDVLHVCIPYSDQFVKLVANEIEWYCPNGLVIINSTVPVGTTQKVMDAAGSQKVVHSPVRGVHPNLAEGIKTFVKFVGSDHPSVGIAAMVHFKSIGIKASIIYNSKTTELMKLLDTTYYGVIIAFHAYANELCERENLNFERVMSDANTTYNAGYTKLGKKNVVRPVLFAPPDGKIGGHCVVPNAELLLKQFGQDPLLDAILRHK